MGVTASRFRPNVVSLFWRVKISTTWAKVQLEPYNCLSFEAVGFLQTKN